MVPAMPERQAHRAAKTRGRPLLTPSTQAPQPADKTDRLRLHQHLATPGAAASALLGGVLVVLLWGSADPLRLLGWLVVLGLALGAWIGVVHQHGRSSAGAAPEVWQRRYRACLAAQALVWGLALLLFWSLPSAPRTAAVLLLCATAIWLFARRPGPGVGPAAAGGIPQPRAGDAALHSYELVANSITDMVSVIDEDHVYRLVNDAWCRNTGLARNAVLGQRTSGAFPAGASDERRRATAECIERQEVRRVRASVDAPGMAGRIFETTYYPYSEATAGVRCAVAVTRDVTEQESSRLQLAASAEYLLRTLNATGDAIFATDASDQNEPVRFVNGQMLQMWGVSGPAERVTPAEITRRSRPLWFDPDAEERRVDEIVAANRPHEDLLRLRDGRVLLRRCIPAQVDGRYLRVWSFRDISAEQRALQMARSNEAEQRALLDAFPGFIARQDTNLVYTYVNAPLAARLGFTPEQMVGRSVAELMGAQRGAEVRALVDRALAGERVTYERHHAQVGATDQVTLAVGSHPASGEPAIYTFGVDISDRRRAEQALRDSESELRALLEAFPGYIVAIDQNLRYTYANPRVAALIGSPPDQIVGRPLSDVIGVERTRIVAQEIEQAKRGQAAVVERHYPATPDRGQLDLEMSQVVGPRRHDGHQTCYVFGQDITVRKRAEAALIVSRDEAERANRAKSQFLSSMSHELRTPMNAIIGFGQLLASDAELPLADRHRQHVDEILSAARHLLALINEMLDLGRIEAGDLQVERVAMGLPGLLDDCLGLMHPLARSHGVRLLPAEPGPAGALVLADRTRLKQVLLNLLTNAIKYNRPGGDVALVCRRDGDTMCITVRDHGRGLSATERERLFQPFERLGAGRTEVEGTGIGLALSRRLVQAMGGTIGVDSEVDRGSSFWVRLSLAPMPARPDGTAAAARPMPGAAAHAASGDGPTRTVLYIEDNAVNVILMEAILARLPGLRVLSAPLPLSGLELARSQRPDLILLDIQLPGIDGYEVLRRLRAHDATRAIPVVAVSANAMQADIDAGLAAGFVAYLTKPVSLEHLLDTVQRVLDGRTVATTS
jgi:PAS domain S-box-containing protein